MAQVAAQDPVSAALKRGFKLKLSTEAPDTAPVVVLLGWYGCKDRYLAKYGSLVGGLGYSQLRAILPVEHMWWPWDGGRVKFATMLLEVLLETGICPNRQIIFYAFSNGGTFVVEEVYKLFRAKDRYAAVRKSTVGLIFDSAPSYLHARTLHHSSVLTMQERYPKWARPGISLLIWAILGLILFMSLLLDGFRPTRKVQYWNWLQRADFGVPQLYLYSKRDPLCDSKKLEELIAARKARGDDIETTLWQDTDHVGHFKLYPSQYTATVSLFLKRASGAPTSSAPAASAQIAS